MDKLIRPHYQADDMTVDTIAAIATPPGTGGGIGIIRISGPGAMAAVSKIFSRTIRELKARSDVQPFIFDVQSLISAGSHRAVHGYIFDPKTRIIVDEVLLLSMFAPRSYTAEDVVEIQAHSGHLILQVILDLVLSAGVRLAEPGEFTKRAFLNGRIDLTQAEAVMDIIHARSVSSLRIAVSQGLGHLKEIIGSARELLISLLARIEAAIDFPEETGEILPSDDVADTVEKVLGICQHAILQYEDANFLREGLKLAICGPPNVGKSSIMNRLLEKERSIVTELPGTTRDLIEDNLNINGIPFVISDTAGMHQTDDLVEKIGIERARKHIQESDLILFVKEAGSSMHLKDMSSIIPAGKKTILVLNKMDMVDEVDIEAMLRELPGKLALSGELGELEFPGELALSGELEYSGGFSRIPVVTISALYNVGIYDLRKKITEVATRDLNFSSSVVPNARHKNALKRAVASLETAHQGVLSCFEEETLAIDIGNGVDALGEITGDTAGVDILDRIFSTFCIGK